MPRMTVNKVSFYYELVGSGQPLVLIAGYACDHMFWTPMLDALSKQYQVLIFDNQGVGQTQDNGELLSIELMAANTMQLCVELKLNKPHIVGQSMGGCIAQTIAALYPDKINKLGLITSSPKWREAMLSAFATSLLMRKDNLAFELIFKTMLPWLFGESFLSDPRKIELYKQSILKNPYPQSLIDHERQYEALKQFDGRARLKHIAAPTLVVSGAQDVVSLPMESRWMASQLTLVNPIVELDCAHAIVIEAAHELTAILRQFL